MRTWMARSRGEKGRMNNRAEAEIVISLEVAGFGYQRLRSVYAQYISTLCIGDKEPAIILCCTERFTQLTDPPRLYPLAGVYIFNKIINYNIRIAK